MADKNSALLILPSLSWSTLFLGAGEDTEAEGRMEEGESEEWRVRENKMSLRGTGMDRGSSTGQMDIAKVRV